jgi:hypothetical protein
MKITIIISSFVSILQVFDSDFLNAYTLRWEDADINFTGIYKSRRTSIFGFINLNSLGLTFIPIISIIIGYQLNKKQWYYIFFLLLGGLTALLSNTRYIMVGFSLLTLQILFYKKISVIGMIRYFFIILILFLLTYYLLSLFGYDFIEWFNTRLFSEGSIKETTRFKAIDTFLKFFPDNYFFGLGELLSDEVVKESHRIGSSHIHVGYLSHLVSYGIFGCLFLYSFWVLLVAKLYRTAKRTRYWGSFFAFVTFLWAFATFSNSSMFFYGILYAIIYNKYFSDLYKMNKSIINI